MNSEHLSVDSIPQDHRLYGGGAYKSSPIRLRAGSLSMQYDNGMVRYISSGRNELIRMIYSAVRNKDWLTISPLISDEKIELNSDSFRISYRSRYLSGNIDFVAEYIIVGNSDNSLSFSMKGVAVKSFKKNRTGFCILHPIEECTGKSCTIIHGNGSEEETYFPEYIDPYQPFRDIRSMKWQVAGLNCSLDFEGDIFETEDQRNWTDASYKTYCTPLERHFPVKMSKGELINQRIELKVHGDFQATNSNDDTIKITINRYISFPVPAIGIGRSTRPESMTTNEIRVLSKLKFDQYRVDLHLFDPDWMAIAEASASEAKLLGYPVELALFFDDNALAQCHEVIKWLSGIKPEIALLLLYHKTAAATPDELAETLVPVLKNAFPGVGIATGTNANFAQINRNRPQSAMADYICYSIHPQEHAFDNKTLVENLKAQEYTVKSCKMFSGKKGVWVSPVNIQRRFNANTGNFEVRFAGTGMPPQVDPRLMSLFGASWIAASIKYLCESDISGITLLESVGERGIFQGDYGTRWPGEFRSEKGMIFPVFHVLNYILKHKNHKVVKSISSDPLSVDIITLSDSVTIKAVVNNFTHKRQSVLLPQQINWLITNQLNESNYQIASRDPSFIDNSIEETDIKGNIINLEPWSLMFIDGSFKY